MQTDSAHQSPLKEYITSISTQTGQHLCNWLNDRN